MASLVRYAEAAARILHYFRKRPEIVNDDRRLTGKCFDDDNSKSLIGNRGNQHGIRMEVERAQLLLRHGAEKTDPRIPRGHTLQFLSIVSGADNQQVHVARLFPKRNDGLQPLDYLQPADEQNVRFFVRARSGVAPIVIRRIDEMGQVRHWNREATLGVHSRREAAWGDELIDVPGQRWAAFRCIAKATAGVCLE